MNNLWTAITIGAENFPVIAALFAIPLILSQIFVAKKINFAKAGLSFIFLFYMLCTYALIIFPLPDAVQAAKLSTHDIQYIPFHFVADIVRQSPFCISDVHTYLPALMDDTIWQVVFNVLMLVPFGMFLGYYYKFNGKKVAYASFLLSLFFELTQFSGLYFVYAGSYRLCDVDDLIANTLGGFLGYLLVRKCGKWLPELEKFDIPVHHTASLQKN